jgi:hypothetical protein
MGRVKASFLQVSIDLVEACMKIELSKNPVNLSVMHHRQNPFESERIVPVRFEIMTAVTRDEMPHI